MAARSSEMSRTLDRMRRDFGEAPTVRFVREAAEISEAYDRTLELDPLPRWSLADWSLALCAAFGGLVTGFVLFVLLSTTQLAADNGRWAPAASIAVLTGSVAAKVPVAIEAAPTPASAPEPLAVAAPAYAAQPKAAADRDAPRVRKVRHQKHARRAKRAR
jgi:hypothetical protein